MISKDGENEINISQKNVITSNRIPVFKYNLEKDFSEWKSWRTNDGRILPNVNSSFTLIPDPFDNGSLIMLTSFFDPVVTGKSFGGFGMRAAIKPAITLNNNMYVEFDLYFPNSAVGKYMRFEIWSTSSGGEGSQGMDGYTGNNKTQVYIRTSDLDSIEIIRSDRIGFFNGETWYKKSINAITPVSTGKWEYLNIDLHTEIGTKLTGEQLMIGNINITKIDPDGKTIPNSKNEKMYNEVDPIKSKYNPENGYFLVGTSGSGIIKPDSLKGYHYEIFVDSDKLRPECHIRPPKWFRDEHPNFASKADYEGPEWILPTDEHLNIINSGKKRPDGNSEYKIHGYCLAWVNQSPPWMRQIIPENISSMQWNPNGLFFTGGNNAANMQKKVNRNSARRLFFNHTLYIMRHFMTTDPGYGSSKERGIIPFHSFDVINEEIHESWHSAIIEDNPDEWKTAVKNLSWLIAMTDSDYEDTRMHYIYLFFKYAHIAIPNVMMAEKYKAGYHDNNIVPEYMKMDNHDNNGSIDAYITEKPPLLTFSDYAINIFTKAKVAYNMIKELNTLWKTDPLYDGRNLIECMGMQGHEMVTPVTAKENQNSINMFVNLINAGLLNCICYSQLDMRQPNIAPGGEASAPTVLNEVQADAIGYQYALLFKIFEKYKMNIDHIIFWSPYGASLMNSYVPFDHEKRANKAYFGIMDPQKFISEHSYLDEFFNEEKK